MRGHGLTDRFFLKVLPALMLIAGAGGAGAADEVPDSAKTRGVARAGLTQARICGIRWGRDERHVTDAMKQQVFAAYGYSGYDDPRCIPDAHGRRCEIDHLISRELGGADEVANLWPQSYGSSPWNAVLKDKLENRLHNEVCAGRLTLASARRMMVTDWREAYVKYADQLEGQDDRRSPFQNMYALPRRYPAAHGGGSPRLSGERAGLEPAGRRASHRTRFQVPRLQGSPGLRRPRRRACRGGRAPSGYRIRLGLGEGVLADQEDQGTPRKRLHHGSEDGSARPGVGRLDLCRSAGEGLGGNSPAIERMADE